jgi:hypothetical protein
MDNTERPKFIIGLQQALQKERASQRIYHALTQREANEARRKVLQRGNP